MGKISPEVSRIIGNIADSITVTTTMSLKELNAAFGGQTMENTPKFGYLIAPIQPKNNGNKD